MKYQFDWHKQLQVQMSRMSLVQGVPKVELPIYLELRSNFFPAPAAYEAEPADMDTVFEGQGGWSPHVNVPQSGDASLSWGAWSSRHIVDEPLDDDE